MTSLATSIRIVPVLVAALALVALTGAALAQDARDIDLYAQLGTNDPDVIGVTALDMAMTSDGAFVAAFIEEYEKESENRLVVGRRYAEEGEFQRIHDSDLSGYEGVRDLALAVPRLLTRSAEFDRVYLLLIAKVEAFCAGPRNVCQRDAAVLATVPIDGSGGLSIHDHLMTFPAWERDETLAAHPTITVVENGEDGYESRYVTAAFQAQHNPYGNVASNGKARGNIYLSVYDFSRGLRFDPLETNAMIAGTISSIHRGEEGQEESFVRPDLTNDGLGRWYLALEDHWNERTRVFSAVAVDAGRDYEQNPSLVDKLHRTRGTCTHPAIDMDLGTFDVVCLGRKDGDGAGDLMMVTGNPAQGLYQMLDPLYERCLPEPDVAVRQLSRTYTTARCWYPDRDGYEVMAIEADRNGYVRDAVPINDHDSTTFRPRAASYRGANGAKPTWMWGRSLYGYCTENDLNGAPRPFDAVYLDP